MLPAAYPHHMLRKYAAAVPLLLRPLRTPSSTARQHARQRPRGWAALSLRTVCGASGERTVVVVESPAKVRAHTVTCPPPSAPSHGGRESGQPGGVPECRRALGRHQLPQVQGYSLRHSLTHGCPLRLSIPLRFPCFRRVCCWVATLVVACT